ncbi:MAG: sensor histidine kinase [Spirochaetales bacterium]|nr:sensor histidine kinase [Spirochaetales bacterium]
MADTKKRITAKSFAKSLKIALIYAFVGCLWILLSDKVLLFFARETGHYAFAQTIKGWLYVAASAVLILFLVFSDLKKSDALAQENEILLRELNHRIKNNLQMVLSLLNLHGRKSEFSKETRDLIAAVQSQVQAISLVHQKILGSAESPWVQLDVYLSELMEDLRQIHAALAASVEIQVSVIPVEVPLDTVTSIGMIVSEIITNSMKHGFSGKSGGIITLEAHTLEAGKELEVIVSDNGVGAGPANEDDTGLGFTLIKVLVDQLGGSLSIDGQNGMTVCFRVPLNA